MPLLGNPSARFPNECRLRTVIATTKLPTSTARVPRSRASELKLLLALRDAMPPTDCAARRCAEVRQRCLPAALCVCCTSRPSPATKYRLLSLCLSPFLPSPLLPTRQTHFSPHTQNLHISHNVYPQHTQEKERGGGARRASRGQRRRERGGVSHALFLTIQLSTGACDDQTLVRAQLDPARRI